MTVQSCQTRQEAERAAEPLRAAGLPVALLAARLDDGKHSQRVWEVVIPREQAQFVDRVRLELAQKDPTG